MVATGTRRGHLIYHWRHGWIPLDHFAALSKAKGSHKGAAKIMEKHGIKGVVHKRTDELNPGDHVISTDGPTFLRPGRVEHVSDAAASNALGLTMDHGQRFAVGKEVTHKVIPAADNLPTSARYRVGYYNHVGPTGDHEFYKTRREAEAAVATEIAKRRHNSGQGGLYAVHGGAKITATTHAEELAHKAEKDAAAAKSARIQEVRNGLQDVYRSGKPSPWSEERLREANVKPEVISELMARKDARPEPVLHPDVVKDLRGGSADKHLVTDATGTHFSVERAALHDKIIGQIVGGHKSHDKPAFVMLGGGPASGKTKAAEAAAHDFPGAVTINPDDIKAMLPEYKQLGPDKAAAFTHEESSYLAKQAMAAAIAQRSHVILDAVGDNSVKSVEGKVASAHAAGYSTHARYVTVPTDVAQARAVSRGIRSGRVVPPTVIAHAHAGVSDVFPQVMGKFDTASLHDNTTNWKPVLTTARGQAPTIHDPAAYRAFLRKAKAKG